MTLQCMMLIKTFTGHIWYIYNTFLQRFELFASPGANRSSRLLYRVLPKSIGIVWANICIWRREQSSPLLHEYAIAYSNRPLSKQRPCDAPRRRIWTPLAKHTYTHMLHFNKHNITLNLRRDYGCDTILIFSKLIVH